MVFTLLEGLGERAASLADAVLAHYPGVADGHDRRHLLLTLAAMGPTVAERVVPLLQALARDPEERQWAERLLEKVQGGQTPPPAGK